MLEICLEAAGSGFDLQVNFEVQGPKERVKIA